MFECPAMLRRRQVRPTSATQSLGWVVGADDCCSGFACPCTSDPSPQTGGQSVAGHSFPQMWVAGDPILPTQQLTGCRTQLPSGSVLPAGLRSPLSFVGVGVRLVARASASMRAQTRSGPVPRLARSCSERCCSRVVQLAPGNDEFRALGVLLPTRMIPRGPHW